MQREKLVLLRISGRVQGVGFRAWTRRQAMALGLRGWVRNDPDGSVAALLSGPVDVVDAMMERLRQGPPGASVRNVEQRPSGPLRVPADFQVLR